MSGRQGDHNASAFLPSRLTFAQLNAIVLCVFISVSREAAIPPKSHQRQNYASVCSGALDKPGRYWKASAPETCCQCSMAEGSPPSQPIAPTSSARNMWAPFMVLHVEQLIRVIRGGKQQLPSFLVTVVPPEPLDAIEEKSHVSCGGTFGQCVKETARIIVTLQDRDARIQLLLLVRRQKLRDPQRRIGPISRVSRLSRARDLAPAHVALKRPWASCRAP